MVQLKVERAGGGNVWKHISIPYGSIKSNTERVLDKMHEISIPYGSIKSWFASFRRVR